MNLILKDWVYEINMSLLFMIMFSCKKEESMKEERAEKMIPMEIKLSNVHDEGSRKFIEVSSGMNLGKLETLLGELRKNNTSFEIYDQLYPTSADDDQGAYICYSLEKATNPNCWSMTLGNHGWSGGIYQIPEKTILVQLDDLVKRKLLKKIQISGVTFFSHYAQEDLVKNQEMVKVIENVHKGK